MVSQRQVVNNAEDYAKVAKAVCPGITTMYIPKEQVEGEMTTKLDKEMFIGCKVLPGTRNVHHLVTAIN